MEEKINMIVEKLTGNYESDLQYLNSMKEEALQEFVDKRETLRAINSVIKEVENVQTEVLNNDEDNNEDIVSEESKELFDKVLNELYEDLNNKNYDSALNNCKTLINEVEGIAKTNDPSKIYCSFSSEFEKKLFEKIFAGEKQVIATPYANDVIYILYSQILVEKHRNSEALEALNRALYWNFLNRDARFKMIDLYFRKKEFVNCVEAIKKLQSISYTVVDLAQCYNKMASVYESLNDYKIAYALYFLSFNYVDDENTAMHVQNLLDKHTDLEELTVSDLSDLLVENEIQIGPNANLIDAYRNVTKELIENNSIDEAMMLVQNDYALTKTDGLDDVYEKLLDLKMEAESISQEEKKSSKTRKSTKRVDEEEPLKSEEVKDDIVEEKPKKKVTTTKKTTAKKTSTATSKKTTAKKAATKKTTTKKA